MSPLHMNEFCSRSLFISPVGSKVQQNQPQYPANTINYIVLYCNRLIIPVTAAFTLVSGHPGLEMKICTTVLYSKVHKSPTTCRGCTHVTMYARHLN